MVGWHYPEQFYRQLSELVGVEVFVLSHRPSDAVPASIYQYIAPDRFSFEANLGYDWGCYQQFLQSNLWKKYEYIFFIHDDVLIKHTGFVDKCIELLNSGYCVIGNGRVAAPAAWPKLAPSAYAHACFKPPENFQHDVVRGSFFATTQQALEKLASFEVFWDPLHLTSGFGNWSTKASCAKWQYVCGDHCFHFLSEEYCVSDYLHEFVRGGLEQEAVEKDASLAKPTTVITRKTKTLLIWLITQLATIYMYVYWRKGAPVWRPVILRMLEPLIRFAAGTGRAPQLP